MAHNVSIPGGNGHPIVFSVSGSSLTNVFAAIAQTLTADRLAGTLTINNLNDGTSTTPGPVVQAIQPRVSTAGATLNTIGSGGNGSATPNIYTLTTGAQYTSVDVGTATTVNGSASGSDTVFGGANYTYNANGGSNDILFVSGDNTYNDSSTGGDTVSMGTGHDTVNTGVGATTVFGGLGDGLINLNDSTGGSGTVFLGSGGHIAVNANGYADAITTASPGNTIFGAASVAAGSQLLVNITDTTGAGAHNEIVAGAATTTVFDSVGGNTIFGGTGPLFFVGASAASAISDTISGGSTGTVVFGSTNDNLVVSGASSAGAIFAIAGGGNETLNGANATGSFVFYGLTDTVSGSTETTSVIGGSGTNFFNTGSGTEAILGGTGTNLFTLNEGGAGTHITIFDFGAGNDSVAFGTAADSVSLNSGQVSPDGSSYTITLADNTTVTFVGITTLSGHTI